MTSVFEGVVVRRGLFVSVLCMVSAGTFGSSTPGQMMDAQTLTEDDNSQVAFQPSDSRIVTQNRTQVLESRISVKVVDIETIVVANARLLTRYWVQVDPNTDVEFKNKGSSCSRDSYTATRERCVAIVIPGGRLGDLEQRVVGAPSWEHDRIWLKNLRWNKRVKGWLLNSWREGQGWGFLR